MPTYTGTSAGETLTGSSGDDVIDGLGAGDSLSGLEGADVFTYRTGMGFASAHDGDGADVIDGGDGADRLDVLGDVLQTLRTNSGITVLPTYSLTAGAGGDALFTISQAFDPHGSAPPVPATLVVTTRGVESIAFNFTHSLPLPTHTVPGTLEESYSTNDVLTIGDLTGTAMTGRIDFDGGDGNDTLNALAAINQIVALGGVGNDSLRTGSGNDSLSGEDGNDILFGGGGSNVLSGGLGVDTADYSTAGLGVHVDLNDGVASNNGMGGVDTLSGIENLTGSAFNDVLIGEGSNNNLIGGLGSDYLIGLGGNDFLDGGAGAANALQGGMGNDRYIVSAVGDTLTEFVGEGYDTVETALDSFTLPANFEELRYTGPGAFTGRGSADNNLIIGGGLVDQLYGMAGDDQLYGGGGSDVLYGGAGNDYMDGGAATSDTASYLFAASGVFVNLDRAVPQALNDGDGGVDTLVSIECLTGSNFNDILIGDAQSNVLVGGTGTDILIGGGGNDVLSGGVGAANQMQGGLGDDRYLVSAVGDTLVEFANEGIDGVETSVSTYTLKDNFENLSYTGVGSFTGTGNSVANGISGGANADILSGLDGNDTIAGNGGSDVLIGGNGDDRLFGGDGADVLRGGAGVDSLNGDLGFDTVDYGAAAAGIVVQLSTGAVSNDGDGGHDILSGIEAVIGSAFNDTLLGSGEDNTLNGGLGTDLLVGYAGNDVLIGGAGAANQMQGGLGDDRYVVSVIGDTLVEAANEGTDTVETALGAYTLRTNFENLTYTGAGAFTGTGNASANVLTGGAGNDTFVGAGGDDTINGGGGTDTVVMSGVRADYTIQTGAGFVTVTDGTAGRDGVDTLYGVEHIRFSDGTVLDLTAPAAPATAEDHPFAKSWLSLHEDHGGERPLTLPEIPNHWDGF